MTHVCSTCTSPFNLGWHDDARSFTNAGIHALLGDEIWPSAGGEGGGLVLVRGSLVTLLAVHVAMTVAWCKGGMRARSLHLLYVVAKSRNRELSRMVPIVQCDCDYSSKWRLLTSG